MKPVRIYKDETYYTGWLLRQLSRIDPFHKDKEKQYRDFIILRPTSLVRQRVFQYFTKIFANASDDIKAALQKKEYFFANILTLLPQLALWLDSMDLLTGFCAAILCPIDKDIDTKDDNEIFDYLAHNADLQQEVKIVSDFFYMAGVVQIIEMLLSMKSVIEQRLATTKPVKDSSPV